MDSYEVCLTGLAERDIRGIIRYIAVDLAVPQTADTMLETIEAALDSLASMPEIHPLVQDESLAMAGYRKLIIKNYIAFYTVDNKSKTVNVARVLYSRRNWQNII